MDIIFNILIEILGQFLLELLARFGFDIFANKLKTEILKNGYFSFFAFIFLAVISAFISIFFFNEHFIKNQDFKILNLIFTPIIAGLIFEFTGRKLERKGIEKKRIDSFWHAYVFAFTFTLIRLIFSN